MGDQIWYRGEAKGGPASTPGGGSIHDLGDGVYLTSDPEVARTYADSRAKKQGHPENARAYYVKIDMTRLRALDLTKDPRWNAYLESRPSGRLTVAQMMKQSEHYGVFFDEFVARNRIDLKQYDAVIGPEMNQGAKQMCVMLKNGKQTPLHAKIEANSVLFYEGGRVVKLPPMPSPNIKLPPSSAEVLRVKNPVRRAAGVQGAAAAVGVALAAAAQWLGSVAIERRVRKEIETTHAASIENIFARGDGLLIIVMLQEWKAPNDLGMRARFFLGVAVRGAPDQQTALAAWRNEMKLLPGPEKGMRAIENFVWLPPPE
jgi:hypothetical protein